MENQDNRDEIVLKTTDNLLKEIKSGDAEHGLSIANMLLSEGPNFNPELLVELIEAVLELSILAGSTDAKDYLQEQWPILKKSHLRRLTNKKTSS